MRYLISSTTLLLLLVFIDSLIATPAGDYGPPPADYSSVADDSEGSTDNNSIKDAINAVVKAVGSIVSGITAGTGSGSSYASGNSGDGAFNDHNNTGTTNGTSNGTSNAGATGSINGTFTLPAVLSSVDSVSIPTGQTLIDTFPRLTGFNQTAVDNCPAEAMISYLALRFPCGMVCSAVRPNAIRDDFEALFKADIVIALRASNATGLNVINITAITVLNVVIFNSNHTLVQFGIFISGNLTLAKSAVAVIEAQITQSNSTLFQGQVTVALNPKVFAAMESKSLITGKSGPEAVNALEGGAVAGIILACLFAVGAAGAVVWYKRNHAFNQQDASKPGNNMAKTTALAAAPFAVASNKKRSPARGKDSTTTSMSAASNWRATGGSTLKSALRKKDKLSTLWFNDDNVATINDGFTVPASAVNSLYTPSAGRYSNSDRTSTVGWKKQNDVYDEFEAANMEDSHEVVMPSYFEQDLPSGEIESATENDESSARESLSTFNPGDRFSNLYSQNSHSNADEYYFPEHENVENVTIVDETIHENPAYASMYHGSHRINVDSHLFENVTRPSTMYTVTSTEDETVGL